MKESIKDDWGTLREDLERLSKSFEKNAIDTGEKIVKQAEEKFSELAGKFHNQADPVIKSAIKKGKVLNEYVKNKPWQSVGLAIVAGLIIGLIVKNKRG